MEIELSNKIQMLKKNVNVIKDKNLIPKYV